MFCPWCIVFGSPPGWCSWRSGSGLGVPDSVYSAGGGAQCGSVLVHYCLFFIEEVLSCVVDSDVHLFVADVTKSF